MNFQLQFDNLFAKEKPANTLAVSIRNKKFQEKYNPSHHRRTNPTLFPAILHSSHTILHSLFLAKQCSRYVLAFMLDLAYVQPFMSKHLIESNSSTNVKGKQKKEEKVWFDFNQISRIISNNCWRFSFCYFFFSIRSKKVTERNHWKMLTFCLTIDRMPIKVSSLSKHQIKFDNLFDNRVVP